MWAAPFLDSVVLYITPILIAALGELVVERAGIVNIGIEGMMLAGALGAFAINSLAGPILGPLGAIAAAGLLGLAFAAVILLFRADQIVAGAGLNLLSLGATGLAFRTLEQHHLTDHPIHHTSEYLLAAFVPILAIALATFFTRTRAGLELASIGEQPQAAAAAGISVPRRQLYAILFGSACAGLAGAYLSTMRTAQFQENMTGGSGFLALAIVIFGRWRPAGILLAALFFALVRAIAEKLIVKGAFDPRWSELLKTLPYAISLLALAGLAGRPNAPASLGKPAT